MAFTRRTVTIRAVVGLAAGLALASILPGIASAADVLHIGAYPSNPPFEFKNASGVFEGFEVDIANDVAKRLGMTPEIADYGFQALFSATSSKRIDIAISTITITKERLASQSFTQPYYDSDMGIATKTDSKIASPEDLKGKIVGTLSGSTGEKWAKENTAKYGIAEVKGYNAQQDVLLDLAAGRVDAVVSDVPGMAYAFLKMKDLTIKATIKTGEQYGFMMGKDNPLLTKVNDAISAMKQDGTLAAIHKKWFGSDPAPDSSTAKVEPLPKA
jgi:polar amino acid transport system substrate-binding protein